MEMKAPSVTKGFDLCECTIWEMSLGSVLSVLSLMFQCGPLWSSNEMYDCHMQMRI